MSFTTPPAFQFGQPTDWRLLNNALGQYREGVDAATDVANNRLIGERLAANDLAGAQSVAARVGNLDTNLALGKYKMAQDTSALQNEAARLGIQRDKTMLPLDVQSRQQGIASTGLDIQSKRDAAEKELYGRASAIAQMIEAEPDMARQREMLNKFYNADPRIKGAIGEKLPKELLDDPIAVARYMRAVHAGYQAPQTTKVGKDEALITTSRDPNNPAAPPKVGQIYKNDGNDQFKDEHQLRGELSGHPTVKNFAEIKSGYGRMLEGQNAKSGAGDLAIVYGYMKMLDPTSVVREGEFATAEKTAGVPEQVRIMYNKVLSGERLSDTVRQNFLGMSDGLYKRAEADVGKVQDQYRTLARNYKLRPENVIIDQGIATPPKQDPNLPKFNPPRGMQDVVNGRGINKPMQERLPSQPIPTDAIRALQSNPERAAEFDAKYGPGASRQYLMQR